MQKVSKFNAFQTILLGTQQQELHHDEQEQRYENKQIEGSLFISTVDVASSSSLINLPTSSYSIIIKRDRSSRGKREI